MRAFTGILFAYDALCDIQCNAQSGAGRFEGSTGAESRRRCCGRRDQARAGKVAILSAVLQRLLQLILSKHATLAIILWWYLYCAGVAGAI